MFEALGQPADGDAEEPLFEDDDFEEPVRMVPDAEEGIRIGMHVRHPRFGLGTVRRIEGHGDNQKVTVWFNTIGPKKLLLRFAGLEPA